MSGRLSGPLLTRYATRSPRSAGAETSQQMRPLRLVLTGIVFVGGVAVVSGYALLGDKWPDGTITVHEQLGSSSGALIDGSPDWNTAFEAGLAIWNTYLSR